MAYTINNFNDFEQFVRSYFRSDHSELDSIGNLQYDFMYSMPQKIAAAKNSLREDSAMKGTLRLLEEAEKLMNKSYEDYAKHVPGYYTAVHGMTVLSQSIEKGTIDVSVPAAKQIFDKCTVLEREHKKYGMNLVNVYGVINSIIDGKGAQNTVIDDMKKYGFYDEYAARDHSTEELDEKLTRTSSMQRYQIMQQIANALSAEQNILYYDSLPLASNMWRSALMDDHAPVMLSPEKAVLHLDKLEMNTGTLDLDNYRTLLDSNKAVATHWAKQCFTNMFDGIYNSFELEQMEQDGIDPLLGVYIDGKPISELYADTISEDRPLKAAQTILEGDHTLTVCRLEKQEDGSYTRGAILKGEVRTELEEHISLWHRLLRWLGIEQTKTARLTAKDLEAEEAIEKIRQNKSERTLSEVLQTHDASIINADRVFFKSNVPVGTPSADSYLNGLSMYYAESNGQQRFILHTTDRPATRGHLAVLYMLSNGMSLEDALSTDPLLDGKKKQLGKQFIETITVLDRESFAAENGISTDAANFENSYKDYYNQKTISVVNMYNEKLFPAQRMLEEMIPEIDINDTRQIAEVYPTLAMCTYGAIDIVQSISNAVKSLPDNELASRNIDRASTAKCYKIILDYCNQRENALSARGLTDPNKAFTALITKAGAEKLSNELNGAAPEQKVSIQASYARIADWIEASAKTKAYLLGGEKLSAIQQGSLNHLKSTHPVPKAAADFIENIHKRRFNERDGTAIFPVSDEELVAQFTNVQKEIKPPVLSKGKGM